MVVDAIRLHEVGITVTHNVLEDDRTCHTAVPATLAVEPHNTPDLRRPFVHQVLGLTAQGVELLEGIFQPLAELLVLHEVLDDQGVGADVAPPHFHARRVVHVAAVHVRPNGHNLIVIVVSFHPRRRLEGGHSRTIQEDATLVARDLQGFVRDAGARRAAVEGVCGRPVLCPLVVVVLLQQGWHESQPVGCNLKQDALVDVDVRPGPGLIEPVCLGISGRGPHRVPHAVGVLFLLCAVGGVFAAGGESNKKARRNFDRPAAVWGIHIQWGLCGTARHRAMAPAPAPAPGFARSALLLAPPVAVSRCSSLRYNNK
jgi:hypothetical protein